VLIRATGPRSVAGVIEVSRQQVVVYAAALLAIALIGARYLKESGGRAPPAAAAKLERGRGAPGGGGGGGGAYVHVTGAVRRPGVYRVPSWGRLDAAIRRAGGATRRADLQGVNLAAKVSDGQQVIVPARVRNAGVEAPAAGVAGAGEAAAPISLNTATVEQLDQLEGIGPATAQKILDWRKEHGGFGSVEDLRQISGIGPKRFESLKEKVRM
jgi:competence protein ComEA